MTPTHPRPVVRDPDAKKRHILEAARRLLVERDFSSIVLDDVAKRAGVAKGTLFLYFKNKEDLFSAAFSDLVDALGQELDALAKTELAGKELLAAAAKVVLNHFDRNRDFMGPAARGRLPNCGARSGDKLMEKIRANHARVRELLVRSASDAGRSIVDPEFAAAAFIGLCRTAVVRKLAYGREGALEKESDRVVAFFVEGSGISL